MLAGLCGALLAGGLDPFDAGSVGAWLHGLAGRLAADGGAPDVGVRRASTPCRAALPAPGHLADWRVTVDSDAARRRPGSTSSAIRANVEALCGAHHAPR